MADQNLGVPKAQGVEHFPKKGAGSKGGWGVRKKGGGGGLELFDSHGLSYDINEFHFSCFDIFVQRNLGIYARYSSITNFRRVKNSAPR